MSEETKNEGQVPAVSGAVPEYLKQYQSQPQNDAASMATSSVSVPRLSYRGKRFRFIENKEEELVPTLTVKVVILGVEPDAGHFIKTYYEKGYEPGSTDPPTCSSTDGIIPDAWVSAKQSNTCASCQKNVFGSATSMKGGKAKACKDGKRLWVAKDPGSFPGASIEKQYGLNIPVMSLKHLSEYGKYIGRNKYPINLVVTEVGMDDSSEFPLLTFKHVGFLPEDIVETSMRINSERPWKSTFDGVAMIDGPEEMKTLPGPATSAPNSSAPVEASKSIEDVVKAW